MKTVLTRLMVVISLTLSIFVWLVLLMGTFTPTPAVAAPPAGIDPQAWAKIQELLPAVSQAPIQTETAILTGDDTQQLDEFGISVAFSEDVIVVGSRGYLNPGAVYVFERPDKGWQTMTQTAKLTSNNSSLGYKVAIAGDVIVSKGAWESTIYLFERPEAGWQNMVTETAQLKIESSAKNLAGDALAIEGDVVAVGMTYHDEDRTGAVYLFERPETGWQTMTQTAVLTGSDTSHESRFGSSIAMDGDTILVDASRVWTVEQPLGGLYLFEKPAAGWQNMTETVKLDFNHIDYSYRSIDLNAGTIVVGGAEVLGPNAVGGVVYVAERPAGGWSKPHQFIKLSTSQVTMDFIGADCNVAVEGDLILCGDIQGGLGPGYGYLFVRPSDGWKPMTETVKLHGTTSQGLGGDVDIENNTIIAGARLSNSAYVFEFNRYWTYLPIINRP